MPKGNGSAFGNAANMAKKMKRVNRFKKKEENIVSIDASIVQNEVINSVVTPPSDNGPFYGFSPQNDTNKLKRRSVDPESFQMSSIETLSKRLSVGIERLTSDDEPFLGFSSENESVSDIKLVVSGSQSICGSDEPVAPSLSHEHLVEHKENGIHPEQNSQNIEINDEWRVRRQSFFKIILGDYCQFSPKFPYPQHQCTAMAATALAYNTLKPIVEWNGNDLNDMEF